MNKMPAKVLTVDDHPMTRHGIARLLEPQPDLVVCGEAEDAPRALATVRPLKPQAVLAGREFEVFRLLGQGLTTGGIGRR